MNKKLIFYLAGWTSIILAVWIIIFHDDAEYPGLLNAVIPYAFSIIGISCADLMAKEGINNIRRISGRELIWSKIVLGLWISLLPSLGFIFMIQEYFDPDIRCLLSLVVCFLYAIIFMIYVIFGKGLWHFERDKSQW